MGKECRTHYTHGRVLEHIIHKRLSPRICAEKAMNTRGKLFFEKYFDAACFAAWEQKYFEFFLTNDSN